MTKYKSFGENNIVYKALIYAKYATKKVLLLAAVKLAIPW